MKAAVIDTLGAAPRDRLPRPVAVAVAVAVDLVLVKVEAAALGTPTNRTVQPGACTTRWP
jgi:hypothetical protein